MSIFKSLFTPVFLLIIAFTFSACTKKKSQLEYGLKIEETLRIHVATEPPTLDWTKATDTTSSLINNNLMEGLVGYNLNDPELSLAPGLATEWKSANNSKTWTFTLREGVKWSDGKAFTAQQVLDGWERLLAPATASEYAYFLFAIKNAQEFNKGTVKDFSKVGAKINAEGQIVVELEKPAAYFPMLMTHTSTYPVRKDVIEKHGDRWTEAGNLVSLGPFTLKIWEHDKSIVLERNEYYFGEKPKIKNVLGYIISELSTATTLFDTGRLDFQNSVPSSELSHMRKRPEYKEQGILGTFYVGFNVKKAPFDNLKVRKAFSMAVDRKEIATMLAGGQIPMTSWIPAGMFGYEADRGIKFDKAAASAMLDEAGFKDRSKLPKVTLAFNTNDDNKRIAENLQAQLKRNLGVNVELSNEEWKVYLKTLNTDPPQLFRLGWLADYPDPHNFMNLMTSTSEQNRTNWGSAEFDKYVKEASSISDKEKRRELYSKAHEVLTEKEVPVIPIYTMVAQVLIADRVKNLTLNPLQTYLFKGVELK